MPGIGENSSSSNGFVPVIFSFTEYNLVTTMIHRLAARRCVHARDERRCCLPFIASKEVQRSRAWLIST